MAQLLERLAEALPERYVVKAELGRGGMSVVFLVYDRQHECDVALKVLRPELSATLGPARFLDEIKTAARLKHPYILKLHDSGEAAGLLYYVMPYVEGESLRHRLVRDRQLPLADALQIAREVAEALDYAHRQNVVHRDIKPENILFEGGHAVVSDFGIALAINRAHSRDTGTGVALGTVEYMSPEQAQGKRDLDGRSDVYSLALVLYEMLSGDPPRLELDGPVKTLERLRPDVPTGLGAVLTRALTADPAGRYATAGEFAEALARVGPRHFYERREVQVMAMPVAAVLALGVWWAAGSGGNALDPNKLVVFPLGERGREGAGEAVALMIGSALEHTEPLKWIYGWTRLTSAERADVNQLTRRAARRISRDEGARYYIDGSIVEGGDSATVILRVTDVVGDSLVMQASARGSTRITSLPQLGLHATTEILPRLLPTGGDIDLTMLTGRRPAAVANWLQGERRYRRSNFVEALSHFRRAVGEDSALAVAALRGAQAASWENANDEAAALAGVALKNVGLLSPRQAHFARGLAAYFSGQADSAVMWLTRALRDAPDWTEAHMTLGEVYYHELPNASGSLDSLASAEFVAAAADTGFSPALYHLAEIAIRSGDFAVAAEAVARFGSAAPGAAEGQAELALMLRCAAKGPGGMDWPSLARVAPFGSLKVAKALAVAATFPLCAEDGFRAILSDTTIALNLRWGALVGLQSLLASQNRLRELRAVLDSAISGLEYANRLYILDALAELDVGDRAATIAAEYERGTPGRTITPSVLWLLGAWRAQSGAVAKAESLHAVLKKDAARTGDPTAIRYARALGARLALQRGDTTAVDGLRMLFAVGTRDALTWGLGDPLAADRLLVGRYLLAHGRPAETLAIASTFDHPSSITLLPFLPASLALRREAARALGRDALARQFEKRLSQLGRGDLLATQHHDLSGREP